MLNQRFKTLGRALKDDWRGTRFVSLGLVVVLATSLIVLAYYLNHPTPETYPDTATYLSVTQQILSSGKLVDTVRLPGYPLLIALAFLVAGQGNLLAVSITQGGLFVLAVGEVYIITCLLTRRAWMGLAVGLLVGANIYVLSYVKPILSEGMSLWIVTSLAPALLLFLRSLRIWHFWLVAVFLLFASMTRAEWVYGPALLFAFLLLIAARHGRFRRLAPHVLGAALLIYAVLGLYIYENAALNGFAGVTVVQRANLLGKVLQYDMQGEAPPQYATLAREADAYQATGKIDPYGFADLHPELMANNWALANDYATAIVEQHPLEFVLKTVPVFLVSSNEVFLRSSITSQGPFSTPLFVLQRLSLSTVTLYRFFPLFALFWLALLFWRRAAQQRVVEMMGALSLVGLYELVLISFGGYSDYSRLHIAFDPLMLVVICASLLLALPLLAQRIQQHALLNARLAQLWPRICWGWAGVIAAVIIVGALATLLTQGSSALRYLHTWSGYAFLVDHPLLPALFLGLVALSLYCTYQARRFQASAARAGTPEHDPSPEQAAALTEPSAGD